MGGLASRDRSLVVDRESRESLDDPESRETFSVARELMELNFGGRDESLLVGRASRAESLVEVRASRESLVDRESSRAGGLESREPELTG